MKNRYSKTWTTIASLAGVVGLGLATAALSLAEPGPAPRVANSANLLAEPLGQGRSGGALVLDPIGPVAPDPDPDPEPKPEPEPEPVDTDKVIVLKPDQSPESIDADGRFTGSATFESWGDGLEKVVLVIAGRTLDQDGIVVPGASVTAGLDVAGLSLLSKKREESEAVTCRRRPCFEPDPNMFPTVTGFSDKFGQYRLQLTYYARSDAGRNAWLQATRGGYTPCRLDQVELGSDVREDLDLTMGKASSITGRVVDERMMPISGVVVYAYCDMTSGQATTAEDGTFIINDIGAGDVYLCCYSETYLWEGDGGLQLKVRGGETSRLSSDIQLMTRTTASLDLRMLGEETGDWINGTIEFRDSEGMVVHTVWFDCAKDEAACHVKAALDYLPTGSWDMRVFASGNKHWKGELRVCTNANMQNDLGTVYLNETDEVPPDIIQPCLEKCCG